jgi:hypothetical protein
MGEIQEAVVEALASLAQELISSFSMAASQSSNFLTD